MEPRTPGDGPRRHSAKPPAAMHMPSPTPPSGGPLVVVDTDPGVDDIFALMLLLNPAAPVRLLAITATYGNVGLDDTFLNVHAALREANRTDVPVYKGAQSPLTSPENTVCNFFGPDGLYGTGERWRPPSSVPVPQESAAEALVRLVRENPGEVTVLALGPLTNLALALQLWPGLGSALRQVVVLGGSKRGQGNVTPTAEFNFHLDPEAAAAVLQRTTAPITVVPWETTVESELPQDVFLRAVADSPFLTDISRGLLRYHRETLGQDVINLGDFYAAAALLDPTVVQETEVLPGAVETCGGLTRGMLVLDRRPLPDKLHAKLTLVEALDKGRLEEMLATTVW